MRRATKTLKADNGDLLVRIPRALAEWAHMRIGSVVVARSGKSGNKHVIVIDRADRDDVEVVTVLGL